MGPNDKVIKAKFPTGQLSPISDITTSILDKAKEPRVGNTGCTIDQAEEAVSNLKMAKSEIEAGIVSLRSAYRECSDEELKTAIAAIEEIVGDYVDPVLSVLDTRLKEDGEREEYDRERKLMAGERQVHQRDSV